MTATKNYCAILGVTLAALVAAAAAPPNGTPPQKTQLQSLPAKIAGIIIAPDDTVWCETSTYQLIASTLTRERLKKELRDQWGRPMPRLTGAKPVLFQKSGRIWFSSPYYERRKQKFGDILLAYDGKEFIEPPDHEHTIGIARESVGDGANLWNAECAGIPYFITDNGVAQFDGTKLVAVPLGTPAPIIFGGRLFPGADGQSLLLLGFDPKTRLSMCFQFLKGKWTSTAIPASVENFDILPLGTSQLLFWMAARNTGQMGAAATSPINQNKNINALIVQLADPAYAKRRAASEELVDAGPLILPKLIAASKVAVDEESQARLRDIIAHGTPSPPDTRIGPYRAAGIYGAVGDANGRAYISACAVTENGRTLGDGLIVADGVHWNFLPDETVFEGMLKPDARGEQAFTALVCGESLWLHDYRSNHPNGLRRLNIPKRRLDPPIPRPDLRWIFGMQKNGAVYAGLSYQGALGNTEVVVYRPDLPPLARQNVPVITRELWGLECAPDGKLWSCDIDANQIMCFDGAAWKPRAPFSPHIQSFIVGANDTLIVQTRNESSEKAALITPHGTDTASDLRTLIEDHAPEIAAAFGNSHVDYFDGGHDLIVDYEHNIWLRTGSSVQVFAGGKWISLQPPAVDHGDMRLLPTTDGPTIVARKDDESWKAFTASVADGKPLLTPWPSPPRYSAEFVSNFPTTAAAAECLRNRQLPPTFDGTLAFDDGVGHLWTHGHSIGKVTLFHDGENAGALEVAGLPEYWTGATDHAGNVYLLTSLGLEHWAYDKTVTPVPFARRETYNLPTLPKQVNSITWSKLGYLAIWGMTEKPPGFVGGMYRHDVLLIKIADPPKPSPTNQPKNQK